MLNILYWVKTPNTLLNISQRFYFQLLAESRQQYLHVEGITQGKDWWHVFEISWLNHLGLPQVAIGRLTLPANSPNLIESKSLKLYFNSMNFYAV